MTFSRWSLNPLLTGIFFELGIIFLFQILVRRIWVHPGREPKFSLNYQQGRLKTLSVVYFGLLAVYFEYSTIMVGPNFAFVNIRMLLLMYMVFYIGQQTAYIVLLIDFATRLVLTGGTQLERSFLFLIFYAVIIFLLGFARQRLWTSKVTTIIVTSLVLIPLFWLSVYVIHFPIEQQITLTDMYEQIAIFWIMDTVLYFAIVFLDRDNRSYVQRVHQATIDELTGLGNYAAFTTTFNHDYKQAQNDGGALILVAMDIDRFKRINDTYGHLGGNRVLTTVGNMLREYAGSDKDIDVYRVGGEEFEMILTGMTLPTAKVLAREIQVNAENKSVSYQRHEIQFTMSFGVAQLREVDDTPDHLYERADRMLYQSKGRGRNEITLDKSEKDPGRN
ncbi:MAG TPA: hypothetical protein DCW31_11145 [Lactobacillus sp.]|nr:hypothetical protein [Lactobacillus sp.]